ncbi:unnamed protein product [Caenorhabditis auriculariae]|uniref:Uncharacterized protein n=1 Tax=Caenorhabditis auriculariae TaxID=2777116 RepID=A0A8S1HUR7_9PELO|nr:unnamed protein product [Caenorhabditis auriculariae]
MYPMSAENSVYNNPDQRKLNERQKLQQTLATENGLFTEGVSEAVIETSTTRPFDFDGSRKANSSARRIIEAFVVAEMGNGDWAVYSKDIGYYFMINGNFLANLGCYLRLNVPESTRPGTKLEEDDFEDLGIFYPPTKDINIRYFQTKKLSLISLKVSVSVETDGALWIEKNYISPEHIYDPMSLIVKALHPNIEAEKTYWLCLELLSESEGFFIVKVHKDFKRKEADMLENSICDYDLPFEKIGKIINWLGNQLKVTMAGKTPLAISHFKYRLNSRGSTPELADVSERDRTFSPPKPDLNLSSDLRQCTAAVHDTIKCKRIGQFGSFIRDGQRFFNVTLPSCSNGCVEKDVRNFPKPEKTSVHQEPNLNSSGLGERKSSTKDENISNQKTPETLFCLPPQSTEQTSSRKKVGSEPEREEKESLESVWHQREDLDEEKIVPHAETRKKSITEEANEYAETIEIIMNRLKTMEPEKAKKQMKRFLKALDQLISTVKTDNPEILEKFEALGEILRKRQRCLQEMTRLSI